MCAGRCARLLILSAILKGDQLEVKFHPDAPVDAARLAALTEANRARMRLTPSFQVMVRIRDRDYEQDLLPETRRRLAGSGGV